MKKIHVDESSGRHKAKRSGFGSYPIEKRVTSGTGAEIKLEPDVGGIAESRGAQTLSLDGEAAKPPWSRKNAFLARSL